MMMPMDIGKAYFHAPATRNIFIQLPAEDAQPGVVGKLVKSLFRTQGAALNWPEAYTAALFEFGFGKGNANPCCFVHVGLDIQTVFHGDDFHERRPKNSSRKMERDMMKNFKVKSELLGPAGEEGCVQQANFLNRILAWEAQSIVWEPDPRHAEVIIRQLGLEGDRPDKAPGVKEESWR